MSIFNNRWILDNQVPLINFTLIILTKKITRLEGTRKVGTTF